MQKFFDSLANIFKIPDLRRRVIFMLALLAVYRVGAYIPTPGIDWVRFQAYFARVASGGFLGYFDLFSGGMLSRMTIFALGITPYITASIILQLLAVVIPTLEKMQKEGEMGRRKITQWTRYLTIGLAIAQSFGIAEALQNSDGNFVAHPGIGFVSMTVLTLTTGSAFIMWLGEQISDRGIGNGMSLLIFVGIIVGLPGAIGGMYRRVFITHDWGTLQLVTIVVVMVVVCGFVVLVEQGERRIPVQYAKRIVGRKMMGGQSTHMPLKVNAGGVMPIIFAQSLLALPQTALQFPAVKSSVWLSGMFGAISGSAPLYYLLVIILIIFFGFFYVSIIFNPVEAADNMRKYGGFIPGIRPGKSTADYIDKILSKITLVGGLYLAILALIPQIMIMGIKLQTLPLIGNFIDAHFPRWLLDGLGVNFYFGGTSLLIVIGVAMDTINQIEAQLVMRHYEGFTPRRGRRSRRT